ncbi:MAG TPA: hypothetical protein VIB39_13150 [Candidatus Angelobacter sp.]|jgi:hypothetical protein
MQNLPMLYREESRPPRLLTWPLVFLGVGVIVATNSRELFQSQPALFALYVFAGGLVTVFLLEFVVVAIEVTGTEVRFSISPFYIRRIMVADILHDEVRTYPISATATGRSWRPPKHCIELTMKSGSMVTLFSAHPEKILDAIGRAKEMSAGLPQLDVARNH